MSDLVSLADAAADGRRVLFEGKPRTVRLSLDAGEEVPAHRHPDRTVVCHVVEGELDVRLDDETVSCEAGDVVRFDGDRDISPRARTDVVAVLVLATDD